MAAAIRFMRMSGIPQLSVNPSDENAKPLSNDARWPTLTFFQEFDAVMPSTPAAEESIERSQRLRSGVFQLPT